MSGIVLMIPDVDYSQNNIGQVTILQDIDVESISITGPSVVEEATAQFGVSYTPAATSQVGVDWSLDSGSEYATISSNGLLTLTQPVSESVNIVIRATSIFDPTVYETKTVRLSSGAAIPVSVTYINGSRKATQNGVNTGYSNMATFSDDSLLNWIDNSYKVTIDSSYKAYFAIVRASDKKCGVRSSTLYGAGEYDVTSLLESIKGSLDTSTYNLFALVVVDASYNASTGSGPNVDPSAISSHISISKIS